MNREKREWQPREMRMVAEYLQLNYAQYLCRQRVRLGSIPDKLRGRLLGKGEEHMAGVWRRWADAVVVKPDEIIIIEAGIKPDPGDISKLKLYRSLLPHTPEFEAFANLPIQLELVWALVDVFLEQIARYDGIRVVYYKPDWIGDYLSIVYPREAQASLGNIEDLTK